jgi:hypothetical protein
MADVLARRATEAGVRIDLRRSDLRQVSLWPPDHDDRRDVAPFDLALAIFTVLNYVTSEHDVSHLARQLAAVLRPGAHVVFDIAARRLFAPALFESPRLHREIDVRELAPDLFSYRDTGCGTLDGSRFSYDETFMFRHWREHEVLPRFASAGLALETEVTHRLRESGSRWFVLRRT